MKDFIQWVCLVILIVCLCGFIASAIYNFIYLFDPNCGYFQLAPVNSIMNNFFNWIFGICLSYLVIEIDND